MWGVWGRKWGVAAAAGVAAAVIFAPWTAWLPGAIALPLLVLAGLPLGGLQSPGRLTRVIAWIPGSEILFPAQVSAGLGFPTRPALHRLAVGAGAALLSGLWMVADSLMSYDHYRPLMEVWPDRLLDERIEVLDRVPLGVRGEWHGVDVVGDHAVVIAEETMRLMAFPLDGGPPVVHKLGERWDGEIRAATLDSESDPERGLTWLIDGPNRVRAFRLHPDRWELVKTRELGMHMQYTYMRRDLERDRLYLSSVQASHEGPRMIATLRLPELGLVGVREYHTPDGALPMPREIEWVPTIGKMVVAPDFGDQLYLADPGTALATPWITVPTLNGKMRWVPELERLLLAIPNRAEMWLVDPATGEVDHRIPTQPGVRSIAIDPGRGVVVSGSVITGTILVQRIEDGEVLDWFTTVMPMVREMKLDTERGLAILSTWSVLYKIPYTDKL